MSLSIILLEAAGEPMARLPRKLWLTEDCERAVEDGDEKARFLLGLEGDEIPVSLATKLGLTEPSDEELSEAEEPDEELSEMDLRAFADELEIDHEEMAPDELRHVIDAHMAELEGELEAAPKSRRPARDKRRNSAGDK